MRKSLSRILTLAKRNMKEILRDPLSLVFMMAMPLVMQVLFYFIFHGLTDQFDMKYLAPGIVVFAEAFLSLFAGLLISLDRSTSFLSRLCVSPARPYEFIFGYTLALLPLSLVQSVVFFAVGAIIDPTILGVGMIYGILLSLVTSLLFIGFGILFGSVCTEKSIGGVASIVIAGQSVLSGMWFPTTGMSEVVLGVMKALPFKNATDIIKNVTLGVSSVGEEVILPLLIVLLYTALIFSLAILAFRAKMKNR